jgi:microsomal epoxide hydrolase
MALFSKRSDAVPLVNIHGWPGCFLEYLPVVKLLQAKYTPETLPYHLIVPSLPGYLFSSGPSPDRDFSTFDVSCIFRKLFSQLGFDTTGYVVSAGDIGSRVARGLAVDDEACAAIHLNFCFDMHMHGFPRQGLAANEIQGLDKLEDSLRTGIGYGWMHATRPATIGFVLSSNPVALLAWIGEKFLTWTEVTPTLETILSFVTLYWLTDTFPRSIYPYRADFSPTDGVPSHGHPRWHIPDEKTFGFSSFPGEIQRVPKAWIERTGKVTFWKSHDRGGHFPALETPEVMLSDLEEFMEHVAACKRED